MTVGNATTAGGIKQTVIYDGAELSNHDYFTATEAIENGRRYIIVFDDGVTAEGISYSSDWQGGFEEGYERVYGSIVSVSLFEFGGDTAVEPLLTQAGVRAAQNSTKWLAFCVIYNTREDTTSISRKIKKIIKCEKYDI